MLNRKLIRALVHRRVPAQLVVQITDRCNALCPQCGMRATETFQRSSLSPDQVRRLIDAAAKQGVEAISFTGGEPLLMIDRLVDYIELAGRAGICYIRTGTNGFLFARPDQPDFEDRVRRVVDKLAGTPLRNFWISIDSAEPGVHEAMRGFPGLVRGIAKALPHFHAAGLYPSANLGINRNMSGDSPERRLPEIGSNPAPDDLERFYERSIEGFGRYYRFVRDLGFTMVNACYPMSLDGSDSLDSVYRATAVDSVVRFSRVEKATLFRALFDAIPRFRSELRIFTPRTSLLALRRQYGGPDSEPYPCRGGIDFFFVDSRNGDTFPCGYRGADNLGPFWDLNLRNRPETVCRECDWECFRDPSEMVGPILHGLRNPFSLAGHMAKNRDYRRVWAEDLRYFRACGWFDGRKPPEARKLARWGPAR